MENDIKKQILGVLSQNPLDESGRDIWQNLILKIEPAEKLAAVLEDIKKDPRAIKAYSDYFLKVRKAFEEEDPVKLEELYNDVLIESHIKNYRQFLKFKLASWDLKKKFLKQE